MASRPRPLSPVLRWLERATDHRIAVSDERGAHAYDALVARSLVASSSLRGDRASLDGARVALLLGPGADFVSAFFAVLHAGGVVVVLSPLHPKEETAYFCKDAAVTCIVAHDEFASLLPGEVPVVDGRKLGRGEPPARSARDNVGLEAYGEHVPALQLYTSGTTAKPKGALISHGNLAVQQGLLAEAWAVTAADTLLHALPLHHMHGLAIALLTAIGAGARVNMHAKFQANAVWEAMKDATVFMAVPSMYHKLLQAFDEAPPDVRDRWTDHARALRLATSGSAALPVSLAERWLHIAGVIPLERFGMTEIGVGFANPRAGERRPGTVGLALPTVESRITSDGKEAPEGELWIAGPSVFLGYHERPKANDESFVMEGDVRWFRTGDTVTKDDGGYLRILGRTSVDILKSGGYKLSALEIEEALRAHPSVSEVAVIGVPHELWGDEVVACIVPKGGQGVDPEVLTAFLKERLAPYKVPKRYLAYAELPKNAVGKVQKPALREKLMA